MTQQSIVSSPLRCAIGRWRLSFGQQQRSVEISVLVSHEPVDPIYDSLHAGLALALALRSLGGWHGLL